MDIGPLGRAAIRCARVWAWPDLRRIACVSKSSHVSSLAVLSIVSWNIENLAPYLGASADASTLGLRQIVALLGKPDLLCLQEIRLRPQDQASIERARAALPDYEAHFSLNRDTENASFRGGRAHGVVTYQRVGLGGEHSLLPWDREGRVLITRLASQRLAVVNVYAVNGTAKPYFDHELGRVEGDRHAFKRRFNRRLMQTCAELRLQGWQLLLIGDWNISRAAIDTVPRLRTEEPHALARRLFNEEFMPGLDVVDAFRQLHPDARKYTWFHRNAPPGRLDAARVDFALLSAGLLPQLEAAEILDDEALRFGSDHAALLVRLRT
jgi:exonuclease III